MPGEQIAVCIADAPFPLSLLHQHRKYTGEAVFHNALTLHAAAAPAVRAIIEAYFAPGEGTAVVRERELLP